MRFTGGVIDTDSGLTNLLPHLREAAWVALDTEADSLHAYPAKLCLLQLGLKSGEVLVDPLAQLDLRPLLAELGHPMLILHGADYDLRLLHQTYGFHPRRVFDTMLAARLLGFQAFALTQLVHRLLGVHLEKGPQKADWARRPLTERMVKYALNDARYLKPLADHLQAELATRGRLDWHREMCVRLVRDSANVEQPDPDAVWRVRGADKLDRQGLALLRELWHWREKEARAANRPPYFVLPHETLPLLAHAAVHGHAVHRWIPPRMSTSRRERLLAAIARGTASPASAWPPLRRPAGHRFSPPEKRRLQELRERRDRRAAELGLEASLIASRATLIALARDGTAPPSDLMEWQRALLEP
jgi:ribonuclease D